MSEKLTKKQEVVFAFIKDFIIQNNFSPSIREICDGCNLSSPATVHVHLKNLIDKNFLKKANNSSRSLQLVDYSPPKEVSNLLKIPLLGKVTAGSPIEAIEFPDEFLEIPSSLINTQNELFSLNVSGDSMINVGIYDNDIIVVAKQPDARNGDIVVAMTDEFEVTVKTFYKENNYFRLQPENDSMEPLTYENITILGKVVAMYRKL